MLTRFAMLVAEPVQQQTAALSAPSGDSILQFLQFGVVGLLVVLLATRKGFVPEWSLRNEEIRAAEERTRLIDAANAERARLIEAAASERAELTQRLADKETQVNRLQALFEEQMLPALWRATDVNTRYLEELEEQRIQRSAKSARPRRTDEESNNDAG